ncbi:MAG: type II secretion system protein [Gemmataceae bacterium]
MVLGRLNKSSFPSPRLFAMCRLHRSRSTAFTILEMLVVIAILGVFLGLLLHELAGGTHAQRR